MTIERVYTVPLRKGFHETAEYKKTKKAVITLKEFLARHMKTPLDKVHIGLNLNKELWKHGIKNPPARIKVVVIKEDNGDVKAELFGHKYAHKKKSEKTEEAPKKSTKAAKEKSTGTEDKTPHTHAHESKDVHSHDEKHEHAHGHSHEQQPEKATPKKSSKKKAE
ncbi:MAG TPA: 50S ribosomal protein L31e [Alphaproteobacteria bacterium]|nr:50S ribosomal protein L31e [Alphaproteobacteria bacterium]